MVAERWQGFLPATPCWCPRWRLDPNSLPSFSATARNGLFPPLLPALSWLSGALCLLHPCRGVDERLRSPQTPGTPPPQGMWLPSNQPPCTLQPVQHISYSPPSHGTVSSTIRTILQAADHITRSGRKDVSTISLGNWSCFPWSTASVHPLPGVRSLPVSFWWWVLPLSPALANWMECAVRAGGLLFASCLHISTTSTS